MWQETISFVDSAAQAGRQRQHRRGHRRQVRERAVLRSDRRERAVHQPADGDLLRLRPSRRREAVLVSPLARGHRNDLRRRHANPGVPAQRPDPPAGAHSPLTSPPSRSSAPKQDIDVRVAHARRLKVRDIVCGTGSANPATGP